ncbi:aspartate carbamoyltransferase catalytic subunit [Caldinitratiruptor microaerophilus]|uniref:Aspartate carbamoyltransferase n=1 Tax=Caldinitratiruptor microaerophilus TaxID=671077 RepID=A0AA35CK01_9FIRM|nr:aspartate carbamoyltransferase catalytic subunit [Caldinitratiruptor microaerophilus]BDG60690.1 aspartate carbamoyltransferase [Caldinitratiruptor microaerophilus]
MGLRRKDLLGLQDLTREEIDLILDTAESMREIIDRPVKKVPTLRGKVIVNLFYEPSTRTRNSFELAAKYLSADVQSVAVAQSSVQKGETLLDTARNLEVMGADLVIMRHSEGGAPHFLARRLRAGVVNAGDGIHEHPTQGLLDLFTIRRRKGRLSGLKVAIVGDILHSRVARSNIWGLLKYGSEVWVAGPATLLPPGLEALGVHVTHDLDEALDGADVVNVLRIQLERQQKGLFPSVHEYARFWGITPQRLAACKEDVLVLHPGPMNRGVEITSEVADSHRAAILEQVTGGVAVRMAVLYLLLGGGGTGE